MGPMRSFDPRAVGRLECRASETRRAHRAAQHGGGPDAAEALVEALQDLYAHTYGADCDAVRSYAALLAVVHR